MMFGRRRFRPRRPILQRGVVPEPLRRAMRLLEQERFGEAAQAFDQLALEAEERGMVLPAAHLTREAARCYLRLDDLDLAYDRGTRSLELLKRSGRPAAARRLGERMASILREKGRNAEAEALERELKQLPATPSGSVLRGDLPGKCPQCGAPVREDEVLRVGTSSAECSYCGSVVKAG